jgi:hypothetical protein
VRSAEAKLIKITQYLVGFALLPTIVLAPLGLSLIRDARRARPRARPPTEADALFDFVFALDDIDPVSHGY